MGGRKIRRRVEREEGELLIPDCRVIISVLSVQKFKGCQDRKKGSKDIAVYVTRIRLSSSASSF